LTQTIQLKIFGKNFACTVCGHAEFVQETFQITSGGLMAKTKERPTVLICTQCGYVHWFLPQYGRYQLQTETPLPEPDGQ
jgi:transcription elongation factor Elf1